MTTAPPYAPVVTRTEHATYVSVHATTGTGAAYLECVGCVRATAGVPRRWEVRVPAAGRAGRWSVAGVFRTRADAEDRLGELKGVTA